MFEEIWRRWSRDSGKRPKDAATYPLEIRILNVTNDVQRQVEVVTMARYEPSRKRSLISQHFVEIQLLGMRHLDDQRRAELEDIEIEWKSPTLGEYAKYTYRTPCSISPHRGFDVLFGTETFDEPGKPNPFEKAINSRDLKKSLSWKMMLSQTGRKRLSWVSTRSSASSTTTKATSVDDIPSQNHDNIPLAYSRPGSRRQSEQSGTSTSNLPRNELALVEPPSQTRYERPRPPLLVPIHDSALLDQFEDSGTITVAEENVQTPMVHGTDEPRTARNDSVDSHNKAPDYPPLDAANKTLAHNLLNNGDITSMASDAMLIEVENGHTADSKQAEANMPLQPLPYSGDEPCEHELSIGTLSSPQHSETSRLDEGADVDDTTTQFSAVTSWLSSSHSHLVAVEEDAGQIVSNTDPLHFLQESVAAQISPFSAHENGIQKNTDLTPMPQRLDNTGLASSSDDNCPDEGAGENPVYPPDYWKLDNQKEEYYHVDEDTNEIVWYGPIGSLD